MLRIHSFVESINKVFKIVYDFIGISCKIITEYYTFLGLNELCNRGSQNLVYLILYFSVISVNKKCPLRIYLLKIQRLKTLIFFINNN